MRRSIWLPAVLVAGIVAAVGAGSQVGGDGPPFTDTFAVDRAEVRSTTDAMRVPAGAFTGVLMVQESTPLEPLVTERTYYAPDVGLVQEGGLAPVRYGPARGGGHGCFGGARKMWRGPG
jgi:hypothetical protein